VRPRLVHLCHQRSLSEAPLLGFSKDLLSTSIRTARPLPDGRPPFGTGLPAPVLVPPLPFLPASTVFSARSFAGLFHPATGPEVRPVSNLRRHRPRASPRGAPDPSILPGSAVFSHTLQSLPLVVRRTASPRPLPSRRSSRPQGLSRPTSPLSRSRVAAGSDPLLSWASFPFRVLPARSACKVSSSFLVLSFTVTSPGLFSCTCTLSCANAPKDRQAALQRSS